MAVPRGLPYGSFNFLVNLGSDKASAGFSEVVFPPFGAARVAPSSGTPAAPDTAPANLLLRRGFAGSLDLYAWWDRTRLAKRPRGRTVTVELLDDTRRRSVVRWRFSGCLPVGLAYSRLDALTPAILIETLELSFTDVQMS